MGEMFALVMIVLIQCFPQILADNFSSSQQVRLVVFCDSDLHEQCDEASSLLNSKMFSVGNCSYFINGSLMDEKIIRIRGMERFAHRLTAINPQVVLAMGDAKNVHAISIVCRAMGIPLFGYITSSHKHAVSII